ncbi:hypothetical protein L4C54_23410 [Vibrio lamellibrachiae]|uniref:hypothetical protein n=1 Tax=Vibrio lamellibrachiae TaxID=2910253 RepID=UPI003D146932
MKPYPRVTATITKSVNIRQALELKGNNVKFTCLCGREVIPRNAGSDGQRAHYVHVEGSKPCDILRHYKR